MLFRYLVFIIKLGIQTIFRTTPPEIGIVKSGLSKIKLKNKYFHKISDYRKRLRSENGKFTFNEFGAGNRLGTRQKKTVRKIAKKSATSKRNGKKLYKLVDFFDPEIIIEMGTSLGIGTLYICHAAKGKKIVTIDANKDVQEIARREIQKKGFNNIDFVNATFDDVVEKVLKLTKEKKTLVFIDGNHRYSPTLKYFDLCLKHLADGSVLIFDDIHWSKGMQQAWEKIIRSDKIKFTMDMFYLGLTIIGKKEIQSHGYLL